MKIKVGVLAYRYGYYPYTRNILYQVPGVEYVGVWDLFSIANRLARKINSHIRQKISTFNLNNQFYDANLNKIDILHLFNGISYGKTPWVTTFETLVPRYDYILKQYLNVSDIKEISGYHPALWPSFNALANKSCCRLIALSESAKNIQISLLKKYPGFESVIQKITVLHPPQPVQVNSFFDKKIDLDREITFMFVGRDFFRKGGWDVLSVFVHLRQQFGYPIKLIIVSALNHQDYVHPYTIDDVNYVRSVLDDNKDWVTYYRSLPNEQVLELMKQAHIGLLPTYADSYGYSVLEFQSMGCPVISTDIRALGEINNNSVGWIIEVPKNENGDGLYDNDDAYYVMQTKIRNGLEAIVHSIFSNRNAIATKADLAIQRVRELHSPRKYSQKLLEIYQSCLEH